MKLKIQNPVDGPTYVAIVDSETGEHKKAVEVGPNQEVDADLETVTDASQVSFGSVVDREVGAPTPDVPVPTPSEGDQNGEQPAQGDGTEGEGGPTTSAASEKPLYLVEGDTIPEGFSESGLETPDGKTLFHFANDTAGQHSTGNVDGVSVYAEADDNEQPVQAATPADAPPA